MRTRAASSRGIAQFTRRAVAMRASGSIISSAKRQCRSSRYGSMKPPDSSSAPVT